MTEKTPAILIVDDEEMVLSSLKGVFALQTDYDVYSSQNPLEAIEEVKRRPLDLVISDFLMPEMNGIQFLKEARELQPDMVRLLLTGYADKENAIKGINEVGLYHYLEKPWDNDALLNIVQNALKEKSLRQQLSGKIRELEDLVRQHGELESKHHVLTREMEMAARVQRSLLPESFPAYDDYTFSHVYQPSEAVGGDFFDLAVKGSRAVLLISAISNRRLALPVCDRSRGKV